MKNHVYTHDKINHKKEFVSKKDRSIHTNNIERIWRDMRENIHEGLILEAISEHIKAYMLFRFLDLKKSKEKFFKIIGYLK